jgi:hypothetical protein
VRWLPSRNCHQKRHYLLTSSWGNPNLEVWREEEEDILSSFSVPTENHRLNNRSIIPQLGSKAGRLEIGGCNW